MTAGDTEHRVTIDPTLVISGRVTDAETGRPVPAFRLVRGFELSNNRGFVWIEQELVEYRDGRYSLSYTELQDGYAVRIEAPGYKPADSRVFKSGETTPTFDFALTRATADDLLTGVVVRPDGRPAAGAEVALATPEHPLIFENESFRFGRGNGMSFAKAGPDGRFAFDKPPGAYLLAATSDAGYGEARPDEIARSGKIAMKAWGKVRGRARIGRRPAADQTITLMRRNDRPAGPNGVNTFYNIETRTDAQGNFTSDRVIPGALQVARVVITEYGNGMRQHMGCWQEPVDVAPGQAVLTHIGGRGRPVIGRVAVKAPPGVTIDWRRNEPATIQKRQALNLLGEDPHRFDRFAAGLDHDGRFRIDDVPPGSYELERLTVAWRTPHDPRSIRRYLRGLLPPSPMRTLHTPLRSSAPRSIATHS